MKKLTVNKFGLHKMVRRNFSNGLKEFWQENAQKLVWFEKPQDILPNIENNYQWFHKGKMNMAFNCLERTQELKDHSENPAIFYFNISSNQSGYVTYKQLKKKVNIFTRKLKKLEIGKGDKVIIYMPNILQAAEAILACSAIGAVFEFVFYGLGTINLSNTIRELDPKLIITASCTVESDGIHSNKHFVDKAKKQTNQEDLKVLIIQRQEKKLLQLLPGDIDFDTIPIDNDPNIPYQILDSNDPLYIFNSFSYTKHFIRTHKLVRDVGPYTVGLEYSMMRHLGIFYGDNMMTLANFASSLGLSYSLFGPLLRGASTVILEDPYSFTSQPAKMIQENNVKSLYIHADQLQKTVLENPTFIKDSGLDFLFLQDRMKDETNDTKIFKDCLKNKIFLSSTFFSQELGVIGACADWTKPQGLNKNRDLKPADQVEIITKKYDEEKKENIYIKNSYPGMFTRLLNGRKKANYPSFYFDKEHNLNTFVNGQIKNGNLEVKFNTDLNSPYSVIQGVQILKKSIISELIKWEEIHYVYVLPMKESEESSFVVFLEVDEKLIKGSQSERENFIQEIRESMQNLIGDIFDLDEILLFPRLPKRIKENGEVGVDKFLLRKLLDSDKEGILFNQKQEIFEFKDLLKSVTNEQFINK